jgi:hypothetical protein
MRSFYKAPILILLTVFSLQAQEGHETNGGDHLAIRKHAEDLTRVLAREKLKKAVGDGSLKQAVSSYVSSIKPAHFSDLQAAGIYRSMAKCPGLPAAFSCSSVFTKSMLDKKRTRR